MTETISYLEAWATWLSGREVDSQVKMWGYSILWWGRAGKILAFIGGEQFYLTS